MDPMQQMFMRLMRHGRASYSSTESLVEALIEEEALKTPSVIEAFRAVDRRYFLKGSSTREEEDEEEMEAYCDAPVRLGKLHQSAPSVYARAVEALELRPGLSFLNVGSGSGYLTSIVAQLIGPHAVNVGVERHPEIVSLARERCRALGIDAQFLAGNCFNIDPERSMKFDRIYVGAGAPKDARFLFKLLKYDGIIVGPFEDEEDGVQSLTRAVCRGGKKYKVTPLLSVTFAGLVRPVEHPDDPAYMVDNQPLVIHGPSWDASKRDVFPESFRRKVMLLHWMSHLEGTLPHKLPWELWAKYIISMLPWDAFEPEPQPKLCAACSADEPAMQCGRCKKVFYCNRECQRQHWPSHKAGCSA